VEVGLCYSCQLGASSSCCRHLILTSTVGVSLWCSFGCETLFAVVVSQVHITSSLTQFARVCRCYRRSQEGRETSFICYTRKKRDFRLFLLPDLLVFLYLSHLKEDVYTKRQEKLYHGRDCIRFLRRSLTPIKENKRDCLSLSLSHSNLYLYWFQSRSTSYVSLFYSRVCSSSHEQRRVNLMRENLSWEVECPQAKNTSLHENHINPGIETCPSHCQLLSFNAPCRIRDGVTIHWKMKPTEDEKDTPCKKKEVHFLNW
jgi:hypothetical protein